MSLIERNTIHCVDCMEALAEMPDDYVDLAIVDPPYGIGASSDSRFGAKFKGTGSARASYVRKDWDDGCPDDFYFDELVRASKRQIVWGVNHYGYSFGSGRLFWHKTDVKTYTSSKGELAWLSFKTGVDYVYLLWWGAYQKNMVFKEQRIHPTQKPVDLYKWLLQHYAKDGDLILDTHMGSGSSYVACLDMGFDYIGYEIDEDYFAAIEDRVYHFTRQTSLAF